MKYYTLFASVILVIASTISCVNASENPEGLLFVTNFENGIQNNLGGYYNKFERAPSTASTFLMPGISRGQNGRSLRVTSDRKDDGFCGVWMHFFNFRQKAEQYLDVSEYEYLSFWVRGQKGGEKFRLKLADAEWIGQEDALPIGQIRDFLPRGVTTQWQEVLVPIKQFNTLDFTRMGGMTLDFDTPGRYVVYIDDVAFKTNKDVKTPLINQPASNARVKEPFPRAMWVWSTKELLFNKNNARDEFFDFCKQERIDQIWLQLIYAFDPNISVTQVPLLGGEPFKVKCNIHFQDDFRQLLRRAHKEGMTVHVLDGYPEFAQKIYHPMPLAIVDAVIEFNHKSRPDERFDGIHFDNEPYLMIGWRDDDRKQEIMTDFFDLISQCQDRVSEGSEMVFGVDIPFWWHDIEIEFNGEWKAASEHCIDLLDNVGIMNYRDTADGADGMIAHGVDWLVYSDQTDGAQIYMGIETFTYQPTECWMLVGLPYEKYTRAIEAKAKDYSRFSRVDGFRTQIFGDGENIHVGIELPLDPTTQQETEAEKTMVELARRLGASGYKDLADQIQTIRDREKRELARDVEWENPRDYDIIDPVTKEVYAAVRATRIMLPKITFAQESYAEIQSQIAAAEYDFSRYKSYAGIAIHYYKTYKEKLDIERQSR